MSTVEVWWGKPVPTGLSTDIMEFLLAHPAREFRSDEIAGKVNPNKESSVSAALSKLATTGWVRHNSGNHTYRLADRPPEEDMSQIHKPAYRRSDSRGRTNKTAKAQQIDPKHGDLFEVIGPAADGWWWLWSDEHGMFIGRKK